MQLICGDAIDEIKKMIKEGVFVDAIITDPPYEFKGGSDNGGGGMLSKGGRVAHNEILSKLGSNKLLDTGIDFEFLNLTKKLFKKGYNGVFFCSQLQLGTYIQFAETNNYRWNLLVWHKTNPVPACRHRYVSDIEFIFQMKTVDYKIMGEYANKKKVFSSPVNKKDKKIWGHPTIKPIELYDKLLLTHTMEGDVVYDPFCGSGTIFESCAKLNRIGRGSEIDEEYCKNARRRRDEAIIKYSINIPKECNSLDIEVPSKEKTTKETVKDIEKEVIKETSIQNKTKRIKNKTIPLNIFENN